MIEIIFQKEHDADQLFEHMTESIDANDKSDQIQLSEDKKRIKIFIKNMPKGAFHKVKESVYQFIVFKKRDEWLKEMLATRFFYSDPNEQEHILEIIYSIIDGNREDLAAFLSDFDEKNYVQQAIDEIFTGCISFSFDSFIMFRLKLFQDRLRNYLEVAIDEYKLEQEYQMFVQTLRDFLAGREAKHEMIHIIIDDGTQFFDQNLREIKRKELIQGIDRKLLGNHPVYVDSVTIAPLLTIAPEIIYLYTNQPEQPLIRTLSNIFEERLKILPLEVFFANQQASNEKVQ